MEGCTNKEKISLMTAVVALIFGMGLTLAGFIVSPLGEVHDSVLWVLGQMLIYAGGILGVSTYVGGKVTEMEMKINHKLITEKGES